MVRALSNGMNGFIIGVVVAFILFLAMVALWGRWRRQAGGGFGPTEFSDGSLTITPTGYPEEMDGHGKKISPTDNNAAGF
jgi:hypothetical protein